MPSFGMPRRHPDNPFSGFWGYLMSSAFWRRAGRRFVTAVVQTHLDCCHPILLQGTRPRHRSLGSLSRQSPWIIQCPSQQGALRGWSHWTCQAVTGYLCNVSELSLQPAMDRIVSGIKFCMPNFDLRLAPSLLHQVRKDLLQHLCRVLGITLAPIIPVNNRDSESRTIAKHPFEVATSQRRSSPVSSHSL